MITFDLVTWLIAATILLLLLYVAGSFLWPKLWQFRWSRQEARAALKEAPRRLERLEAQLRQLERRVSALDRSSGRYGDLPPSSLRHEGDFQSLSTALQAAFSKVGDTFDLRARLHQLEEQIVGLDERLKRSQNVVQTLSEESLRRNDLDASLRGFSSHFDRRLEEFHEQLEQRTESTLSGPDWPPEWFMQVSARVSDRAQVERLEPLCLSIPLLDRQETRFRVLAELLGLEIGKVFFQLVPVAPKMASAALLDALNSWFRSVDYPFDVFFPAPGDGADPELHVVNGERNGAVRGAVEEVVCWGLRERGGRERVVAKARVTIR